MLANSPRTALMLGAVAAASISFTACGGSNSGGAAGDPEAFCAKYEEFDNTEDFGDDQSELVKGLEELRDLAPSEIKDDLNTAVDAFKVLSEFTVQFEAGEEVDEEDPALVKASDELDVAGDAIEEYVAETCGLES